jgi:phage gp46-like protein
MATQDELFGTDLRLLADVEHGESRAPGSDLQVLRRPERAAPGGPDPVDLRPVAGVENLSQALLLRLLTWRGELAPLGHPEYGSRLHELIGELNTESVRNRAKLYVLQALAAEPRVAEVVSVTVRTSPNERATIVIDVRLRAIGAPAELNLVFPFSLSGGAAA